MAHAVLLSYPPADHDLCRPTLLSRIMRSLVPVTDVLVNSTWNLDVKNAVS
jgi:hypothetical protein